MRRLLNHRPRCILLLLVCVCCACGISDNGLFPPPTLNFLAPAPSWIGLAYESVRLETSKGQPVHAWYIPSDGAEATVLIHHGAFFNRSFIFPHYSMLHDLGYNVMVYDYQGFGENGNIPSLATMLPDADAALAHLQQRDGPGAERIILFGLSLGTLPAIAQAASSPERVVGVIVEGTVVPDLLPPGSLFLSGVVPWVNAVDSMPQELDPGGHIEQISLPKLFLHSKTDLFTPFDGAAGLHERSAEPTQLIEVIGGHVLAVFEDPGYAGHLKGFLDGLASASPGDAE